MADDTDDTVELAGDPLDSLSAAFYWHERSTGLRRAGREDNYTLELIIARVEGLRIEIRSREHPPPHFHVVYQNERASFAISDCGRLRGVKGLEGYDSVIRKWHSEDDNKALLIKKWDDSRPSDCAVGPIGQKRPRGPHRSAARGRRR